MDRGAHALALLEAMAISVLVIALLIEALRCGLMIFCWRNCVYVFCIGVLQGDGFMGSKTTEWRDFGGWCKSISRSLSSGIEGEVEVGGICKEADDPKIS